MGVLRGRIAVACAANVSSFDELDIWVTEHYRIEESWTRQYVVSTNFLLHIEILKDWELLIDNADKVAAIPDPLDEDLAREGVIKITCAYVHVGTLVSPMREQCCGTTRNI
ncbi:hypothetical protein ACHQM5_003748 [Ranunculus cassubicifolius]